MRKTTDQNDPKTHTLQPNSDNSQPIAKPIVGRSASSFKVGQCVSYGGATCWVKKYNGEKCLAYPAMLGWSYFIPGDWNLVEAQ